MHLFHHEFVPYWLLRTEQLSLVISCDDIDPYALNSINFCEYFTIPMGEKRKKKKKRNINILGCLYEKMYLEIFDPQAVHSKVLVSVTFLCSHDEYLLETCWKQRTILALCHQSELLRSVLLRQY